MIATNYDIALFMLPLQCNFIYIYIIYNNISQIWKKKQNAT